MTFTEKTAHLITLANARAWHASPEQWCFVTDNIITAADVGYDPHGGNIDRMVASVERRFEKLLAASPSYSHELFWTATPESGNLAGLELVHSYGCFDDKRTRAHVAALVAAADVGHVHLIERT
jgi:hypothetical protein